MAPPSVISAVLSTAVRLASHNWEYSTVANALLEWNTPQYSIWNAPFTNSTTNPIPKLDVSSTPALSYIKPQIRLTGDTLMPGNAAGDTASSGPFAVMIGQTTPAYLDATKRNVNHLLTAVPRYPNGAISHREDGTQLWSDFIYMAPPTLAYYAVATSNLSLAREAATQIVKYADVLAPKGGLWQHIAPKDLGLWSTGNGWAAAGAARVLATLKKGPLGEDTKTEQAQLVAIIKGILDGVMALPTGLLPNYLSSANANCPAECFGEISGTALLAAAAFRMVRLEPDTFGEKYRTWATGQRAVVDQYIDAKSGVVSPAVNPLAYHDTKPWTSGSPEGQAFVVMLAAAERDLGS